MSKEQARTTKYKNYNRLNRYAKDGETNCVLSFSTADDRPRIGINYGKKTEGGKYTYAGFDYFSFTGFLQAIAFDLRNYLNSTSVKPVELTERVCTCSYMRDGVKTVVGGLKFSVNKEGLVFLCYSAKDFPSVEFTYQPSDWHSFKVRDDSNWKDELPQKVSAYYAYRHILLLLEIYSRDYEDRIISEADATSSIVTTPAKANAPKNDSELPEDDVPF